MLDVPIPTFHELIRPVLALLQDGQPHPSIELRSQLARDFDLSEAELSQKQLNGTSVFTNHVAWALAHLYTAKAIDRPAKGEYLINSRGTNLLDLAGEQIDLAALRAFANSQPGEGDSQSLLGGF